MTCEHCQSEITPMITSWFCAACDTILLVSHDWGLPMACEHCQSEMTPMITRAAAKEATVHHYRGAPPVFDETGSLMNRVVSLDPYAGTIEIAPVRAIGFLRREPPVDDDADLIDEDPGPDCLEPEFYSFCLEDYLYIIDLNCTPRVKRRKNRQTLLQGWSQHISWGNPADIAAEKAVYPEWSPNAGKA